MSGSPPDDVASETPKRWVRIFVHPAIPAVLAVVAPFVGAWIALRRDEIKQVLVHVLPPKMLPYNLDVFLFLFGFAALVLGFALHKRAESSVTRSRQSELTDGIKMLSATQDELSAALGKTVDATTRLDTTVQAIQSSQERVNEELRMLSTLGIDRVGNEFSDAIRATYSPVMVAAFAEEKPERKTIEDAIVEVLGRIIKFAKAVEASPVSTKYSASVFVYLSNSALMQASQRRREYLLDHLQFGKEMGYGLKNLTAILVREPKISFNSSGTTTELVLPVVDLYADESKKLFGVLPGAPYTAASGEFQLFSGLEDIERWCAERADYRQVTRARIMEYFRSDQHVKSFLTIAISGVQYPSNGELLGILSIERSTEGLMAGQRVEAFVPLLTPLLLFLGQLMKSYGGFPKTDPPEA